MKNIVITQEKLESSRLRNDLPSHPCCGAVVLFEGIVRGGAEGNEVAAIEYECYAGMAESEFEKILREAKEKWPVRDIFIFHRIGRVLVGEASLFLAVFSPHRREAFEASQYVIDQMKQRVPLWKKELPPF